MTKLHRWSGLNNRHLFLTVLEANKSEIKVQFETWWGSTSWFIDFLLLLSSCDRRCQRALWVSFRRALISFLRAPPSCPKQPPIPSPCQYHHIRGWMPTYAFWEALTKPGGQIPVYTRDCQEQLWEWRTGRLGLWTNLLRVLVMSKCPQARSTGWCWQVKRFWAWAEGGISDLQTLPASPPPFPGGSHSKSQSTFLIISVCWLWTRDRDQPGDETRRAGGTQGTGRKENQAVDLILFLCH